MQAVESSRRSVVCVQGGLVSCRFIVELLKEVCVVFRLADLLDSSKWLQLKRRWLLHEVTAHRDLKFALLGYLGLLLVHLPLGLPLWPTEAGH